MATATYLSNPVVTVNAVDLSDQCTGATVNINFDERLAPDQSPAVPREAQRESENQHGSGAINDAMGGVSTQVPAMACRI